MEIHRFYQHRYPSPDELVMVEVTEVENTGVKVKLLSYGCMEAQIASNDLSSRRIRTAKQVVREGKQEVCIVTRVDEVRGYVDLSRINITPEDIEQCQEQYREECQAHFLLNSVARQLAQPLEDLYTRVAWPWMNEHDLTLIHMFNSKSFGHIPQEWISTFVVVTDEKMQIKKTDLCVPVKITCNGREGIDAIKAIIREGLQCGKTDYELKIKSRSAPWYDIFVTGSDESQSHEIAATVIQKMKDVAKTYEDASVNETGFPLAEKVSDKIINKNL